MSSALRKQQVLALQLAGLTQAQIADQLGVTPRTIARDVSDLQPTKEVVISTIDRAKKRIAEMMPVEKRIDRYVDFAMNAKTEAVGYSSLVRLDDLDDIVTQKELVRTRRDEASQPAAMFVLNANMQVSFGPDTTSSVTEKVIDIEAVSPLNSDAKS